jgi:hypothetical protein
VSYQSEHQQLQAILARELQDYGPHPLEPEDADAVAWHLADVTLQVVVGAVEREQAKVKDKRAHGLAGVNARQLASDKPTAKGRGWWRRGTS